MAAPADPRAGAILVVSTLLDPSHHCEG
ncbi:hypothetical protein VULLAG_LOCUS13779 [Vulpes lagopus]